MLLTVVIVFIGACLAVFKPIYYVLFFGLLGSDMDALGFVGFFRQYVPYYDLIMLILLVVASFSALWGPNRNANRICFISDIRLSYLLMIFSVLSVIIYFLTTGDEGNFLVRVLKAVALYSPCIMIIWIKQNRTLEDGKKMLFTYITIQCLISFAIIYLSRVGFTFLNNFNAGYYNNGYYYTNEYNDMVALPSNFYLVFTQGKNANFVRTAQFHNSNGLGFAAGTLMFLCIERLAFTKSRLTKKLLYLVLLIISFFLWCCSGTRGVIFGIILGVFIYFIKNLLVKKGSTQLTGAILLLAFFIGIISIVVLSGNNLDNYLSVSGILGSFSSRNQLLTNLFHFFFDYFFVGNGGNLDVAVARGIDPHIISLRIFVMYGIAPSIIMLLVSLIRPIKNVFGIKNLSFYSIGLASIIVLVGSTNNFTAVVLFWLLLAESIIRKSSSCKTIAV